MKEETIRPQKLLSKQNSYTKADILYLQRKKSQFVETPCPACLSKSYKKEFTKEKFQYCRCKQCKTLFMNPRPTAPILDHFYKTSQNYHFWNQYMYPLTENNRRKTIIKRRVKLLQQTCRKYNVSTNTLIEIGAGYGTFCEVIKEKKIFKEVIALEPVPELAKTCKDKGITVIQEVVEKANLIQFQADIVVNFEVIEHLFNPAEFLFGCKNSLTKDGIVILTCPNGKGFDFEILGKNAPGIDHEHLNYFNPRSIEILFRRCGYQVLEVNTPGYLDVSIVKNRLQDTKNKVKKNTFLYTLLYETSEITQNKFQNFLRNNNLSGSLAIVAKLSK